MARRANLRVGGRVLRAFAGVRLGIDATCRRGDNKCRSKRARRCTVERAHAHAQPESQPKPEPELKREPEPKPDEKTAYLASRQAQHPDSNTDADCAGANHRACTACTGGIGYNHGETRPRIAPDARLHGDVAA